MDVVALAQHGVEYAVATLGTSTTPDARAEAVPPDRHRRVLLRRRRRRPQGGVARAREHAAGARRRQERACSCSCPTARIRTTSCAGAARRRSSRRSRQAVPLSEFLLAELAARHPPTSAEGRAALVAAARPLPRADRRRRCWRRILRRRLAELAGLPEARAARAARPSRAGDRAAAPTPPRRRRAPRPGAARAGAAPRAPAAVARAPVHPGAAAPARARARRSTSRSPTSGTPEAAALYRAGRALRRRRATRSRRPASSRLSPARRTADACRRCWPRPRTRWTTLALEAEMREGLDALVAAGAAQRPAGARAGEPSSPARRAGACSSSTTSASGWRTPAHLPAERAGPRPGGSAMI